MIKYLKLIMIVFLVGALFNSCSDYVTNIKAPIDDVADDNLNTPGDIPFLVTGVQTAFAIVWDETSVFAGGLSDEMAFTRDIKQATFPTFEALDLAETGGVNPLVPQNNSTEGIMSELGRLRLIADTLIERVQNRITFDAANADHTALKNLGLFTGYFYGAVARYIWASYWALEAGPEKGGGVINLSPFIPATVMYNDAIARLDEALKYADADQLKYANTFKARILIIQGKYTEAATALAAGMADGDADFAALYNTVLNNYWYYWAGPGRTQFYASDRFGNYVAENPQEAGRIPLYTINGTKDFTPANDTVIGGISYKGGVKTKRKYLQQLKYPEMGSPLPFITWQENTLMKAELAIRANDNAGGLALINEVRASHEIDALTEQNVTDDYKGNYLDLLYVERDKELCFSGMRLIDERRFPGKWHLTTAHWYFFPVGYAERKVNPNFD